MDQVRSALVGSSDTFAAQNARRHWRCSFPIRFRIRCAPNLHKPHSAISLLGMDLVPDVKPDTDR
jgi:hypothetical protein